MAILYIRIITYIIFKTKKQEGKKSIKNDFFLYENCLIIFNVGSFFFFFARTAPSPLSPQISTSSFKNTEIYGRAPVTGIELVIAIKLGNKCSIISLSTI
jgi:hypothetical protein